MEGEDREDLVAVDDLACSVHCEHAIAVAVERDAKIEALARDEVLQGGEVGRAAARVDVPPVGIDADCGHLGAEAPERIGSDARHRSVRAVEPDRQARQVRSEADDRGDVVLLRTLEPVLQAQSLQLFAQRTSRFGIQRVLD